jgi:isopentenyl-diphosphate Delta-isomerase
VIHEVVPGASEVAEEQVVLLEPGGRPIGTQAKADVHTTSTPLHLAFSLHLFDASGRVLITRRALGKATWPGVWTNSCCGHPGAGESMTDAVQRRLGYELGASVTDLVCVLPDFAYTATDASGIQENEICPVYAGRLHPDAVVSANTSEVMDWVWVEWSDLVTAAAAVPSAFSPWAVDQLHRLAASPCP